MALNIDTLYEGVQLTLIYTCCELCTA